MTKTDNDGTVSRMTNTPGHDHPADPYRTTQKQMEHIEAHHHCEDGEHCELELAAACADLIMETVECKECRDAAPALIAHLITEGRLDFARGVILSLASALQYADRKINEGIATYDKMVKSN